MLPYLKAEIIGYWLNILNKGINIIKILCEINTIHYLNNAITNYLMLKQNIFQKLININSCN